MWRQLGLVDGGWCQEARTELKELCRLRKALAECLEDLECLKGIMQTKLLIALLPGGARRGFVLALTLRLVGGQ